MVINVTVMPSRKQRSKSRRKKSFQKGAYSCESKTFLNFLKRKHKHASLQNHMQKCSVCIEPYWLLITITFSAVLPMWQVNCLCLVRIRMGTKSTNVTGVHPLWWGWGSPRGEPILSLHTARGGGFRVGTAVFSSLPMDITMSKVSSAQLIAQLCQDVQRRF